MNVTATSVARFLRDFKKIIKSEDNRFRIIPRPETNATILQLGLTTLQFEEIILSLSVENYSHGPLGDKTCPGLLWVFGTQIDNKEIYIKLKIYDVDGTNHAKCVSFHESVHPLRYPLK